MIDKNARITILTSTYNRPESLKKLYKSLCQQTDKRMVWWIVDDGSTVAVSPTVNQLISNNNDFEIKYTVLKNGGKHRALNAIIPKIVTDLTVIVDDDDVLVDDAIETILKDYEVAKQENIGSLIYEHGKMKNVPVQPLPNKIDFGRRYWYLLNHHISGDFTDVFVTKCLQKFRLPEFKNEKFISEGPLYVEFSKVFRSKFIKKIIRVGAYQPNGLTNSIRKLEIENPNGAIYEQMLYLAQENTPLFYRIKKSVLVGRISAFIKKSPLKNNIIRKKKEINLLIMMSYYMYGFLLKLKEVL